MSALIFILAIVATLIVVDVLAQVFGVDSRPEIDDPRAPVRGISI